MDLNALNASRTDAKFVVLLCVFVNDPEAKHRPGSSFHVAGEEVDAPNMTYLLDPSIASYVQHSKYP